MSQDARVSLHIATVGKGGAGKSVLSGTLARMLARRGHRVLTLDSDPMPGLTLSLGLGIDDTAMLTDAVEKNEQGRWQLRKGIGPYRAVQRFAVDGPDGIRHLQLGKFGEEGQAAMQGSATGWFQLMDRLWRTRSFDKWTILADLAAGPRHVVFEFGRFADTFVLVVEPSWKSALTARRIARLVRSRPGYDVMPIASKVKAPEDRELVESMIGEPVAATIPFDPAVRFAERAGVAPLDHDPESPAMLAIASIADRLEAAHADRRVVTRTA
jgi:CO dehydrogenase maturation factor